LYRSVRILNTRSAIAIRSKQPHVYEVRPRKDHRGVDLIFDVLPFGRLRYDEPEAASNAIGYAKFRNRSAIWRSRSPSFSFPALLTQCLSERERENFN